MSEEEEDLSPEERKKLIMDSHQTKEEEEEEESPASLWRWKRWRNFSLVLVGWPAQKSESAVKAEIRMISKAGHTNPHPSVIL